jgi:hypothetical protein
MITDPYRIVTIANKLIKMNVNMGNIPKEINLECLIIDKMTHVEYYYFWDEDFKDENGKSFTLDDIHKVLNVDILRGIQSGNKKIDKSKFNL